MKKLAVLLTAAIMLIVTIYAGAENAADDLLSQLNGQLFEFCSGVGAWSTELTIGENGTFTGSFHDSELGETGESYPDGTLYGCSFHGQFSDPEPVDDYAWTVKLSVEQDEGQVPEAIEDGIRYVTAAPYGLEKAKTVTIFLPGTPVDRLPEGFMIWSHLQEIAPDAKTIPYYAIWNEADEAGFITAILSEPQDGSGTDDWTPVAGENETGGSVQKITGNIVDGCYVLKVQMDSEGEWRADEMAQDDSVVKLAASGVENGVFTARYEPTGDGEASVVLRHFNEHNTCNELHSFTLLVKNGKVQEEIGGSYQASPDESEVEPYFSGKWLEKDTQFTVLNVTKKNEDGWDIEITSPVSHGSWVIRATVYHACDYDAFVYSNGVKYNLIPGETTREEEAATGLWGTLRFAGTMDHLQLVWYDMINQESETVTFERESGLPAYAYSGDNPIEGAIADFLAADERAKGYLTAPGYVTIPCPIIHKTEMIDAAHAKVYGSFWILNYARRGETLFNISGGEYPAVIMLENADGRWQVTAMEEAGDGEDYAADIERFADGDKDLTERYFAGADLGTDANQAIRTRFIKAYVETNRLDIAAYQDYGWAPVSLK